MTKRARMLRRNRRPVARGSPRLGTPARLDTTKAAMNTAPQVNKDQFTPAGGFDQESQKVDVYWKARLTTITCSK